ncbi:MAG: DNA translocase FtsK [Chloroflexota bacterium]
MRRILGFARPRTGSEALTLLLVILSVGTLAGGGITALLHGQSPDAGVTGCAVLLAGALAARLSPWWRPQLREMTADRARNYIGSMILVLVALSLAFHLASSDLGMSAAYPMLGALSSPPWALVILGALAVLGFAIILDLPVLRWFSILGQRTSDAISSAREQRVLQAAIVEDMIHLPEIVQERELNVGSIFPATRHDSAELPVELVSAKAGTGASLLPPLDTFSPAAKKSGPALDVEQVSTRIQETLASFGVRARVVGHHSGPVVTQFDVQPERGVKVKSITSLQNDLALALAAPTIRIQAPVPGKPVIGIEIPNTAATAVSLRELLESDAFRATRTPLTVVLGKDVAGVPAVIDLARMPHLLIAGATGSGKSVCVNALISCLLYRNAPEDVRLMMVDPKMVELTVYNGVPHLLSPVVTNMDKVVGVLQWAMREMERRYQLFAATTVRNIQRYNEKAVAQGQSKLPYIVLIIDELADLMMVAPEDVEDAVCRLAQLARAAGIHLVIATQRPSVDVVTGLIKANFPARIAFAMTSQVDSRTILDSAGAEKLLGRGDMLYQPPDGPKPVRLQGAFLSDHEIERLVEFWQRSPLQHAVQRIQQEEFEAAERAARESIDDLLDDAIRVAREVQTASITLMQRRLRVGYARAARIMDQLEARGIVGPADGGKQRRVLPPSGESSE